MTILHRHPQRRAGGAHAATAAHGRRPDRRAGVDRRRDGPFGTSRPVRGRHDRCGGRMASRCGRPACARGRAAEGEQPAAQPGGRRRRPASRRERRRRQAGGGQRAAGDEAAVPRQPQGRGRRHPDQPQDRAGGDADPGDRSARTCGRSGRWATSRTCRSRSPRGEGGQRRAASSPSSSTRSRSSEDLRRRQRGGGAQQDQRGPRPQEGAHPRPRQGEEERREDQSDLYVEKGYYLAEVTYEVKRATSSRSTSTSASTSTPRSRCGRSASSATSSIPDASCADVIGTREGGLISFLTSSGTYREDVVRPRPAADPGLLLRPRLHQREGRQARSSSCRPTSSRCTSPSPSTRGRSTASATSTSTATCSRRRRSSSPGCR